MQVSGRLWSSACFFAATMILLVLADLRAQPLTLIGQWNIPLPESSDRRTHVVAQKEYRASGSIGLQVFDMSNPLLPTLLGTYRDPLGKALAVVVTNDLAFVAYGERELQIIDVTDPAHMFRVNGFYATNRPAGGGYGYGPPVVATDLTLVGDLVYLANGLSGLQIVDVSEPSNPTGVGLYQTAAAAVNVTVKGTNATVLADITAYLLDVSNPGTPRLIATTPTIPRISCVAFNGATVVASCDFRGIELIDVSDPATPLTTGSLPLNGYIREIAVHESIVLVAHENAGARVIDITDRNKPQVVATFLTEGIASAVTIVGSRGYVGSTQFVYILDLSDPTQPQLLGRYSRSTAEIWGIAVEGEKILLSLGQDGPLQIINIADPSNPKLVSTIPVQSYACAVRSGIAYIATTTGLQIFDTTGPGQPRFLGSATKPFVPSVRSINVRGSHVYMNDNDGAVAVFQINPDYSPLLIGTYPPATYTDHLTADDNHVFVADYGGGLKIYRNENVGLRLKLSTASGAPQLTVLNATPGTRYVLESKSTLAAPTWSPLLTNIVQTYTGLFSPDANNLAGSGFFRLQAR
jgi:hypothetical protein